MRPAQLDRARNRSRSIVVRLPHNPVRATFIAILLGVIVIVGGLIYFPMLILGPIGERIIG